MRLNEINTTKRALITEGWNDPRLTLLETTHLIPFITSIENYIVEANLTPQQINQMFTDVEAGPHVQERVWRSCRLALQREGREEVGNAAEPPVAELGRVQEVGRSPHVPEMPRLQA